MRLTAASWVVPALLLRRAPRPQLCEEPAEYELSLSKPLGLAFEERSSGFGLEVTEVVKGGSAHEDGSVWPGDLLVAVGGRDVSGMPFDDAMGALIDAPERCDLTLARTRGKMGALRFDGKLVFVRPGEEIPPAAEQASFDVEYNCGQGSCGSCQMVLYDEETEGYRPTRLCRAKVPDGAKASLMPWTVLRPDSPQAQAYTKKMEEKYKKKV